MKSVNKSKPFHANTKLFYFSIVNKDVKFVQFVFYVVPNVSYSTWEHRSVSTPVVDNLSRGSKNHLSPDWNQEKLLCLGISARCQQPCVILPMIALTGSVVKRWQKYVEKGENIKGKWTIIRLLSGDDINTHNQSCNTAIIELHVNTSPRKKNLFQLQ